MNKQIFISGEGAVWYMPEIFSETECERLFELLYTGTEWAPDRIKIYGRDIVTKRKVAWYGDIPFEYRYSGYSRFALSWTKEILEIKERVELLCGTPFNSCLLNLYHDGTEGMGWHSDDEVSLDSDAPIASISFGENRRFLFRLKTDYSQKKEILLQNGSLLLMDADSQKYWQHSLPVFRRCKGCRINLTFRRMK
jgi:alkylated DNA repair dioxygenase AlkB